MGKIPARLRDLICFIAIVAAWASGRTSYAWEIAGTNGGAFFALKGANSVTNGTLFLVDVHVEDYTERGEYVRGYLIGAPEPSSSFYGLGSDHFIDQKFGFLGPDCSSFQVGVQVYDKDFKVIAGATSPKIEVEGKGIGECFGTRRKCDKACSARCVPKKGCYGDGNAHDDFKCQL